MTAKGAKLTEAQRETLSKAHMGQPAWNKGTGRCKNGHDPELYVEMPSGVFVCLGCKRENGLKYRKANRDTINLKNRVDRYGLSAAEFFSLYESQGGCCAICRTPVTRKQCRIDHDHDTGKVRGILCTSCNTGIGLLKDSPELLIRAAEYVEKHNE